MPVFWPSKGLVGTVFTSKPCRQVIYIVLVNRCLRVEQFKASYRTRRTRAAGGGGTVEAAAMIADWVLLGPLTAALRANA